MRIGMLFVFLILFMSNQAFAQQTSGGGTDEDLPGVCSLAGGTWTGSASGNWACCWDNWGCVGCVDGICKVKCHTARCRKANGMSRTQKVPNGLQSVPGLGVKGMKAPIVPIRKPKTEQRTTPNQVQ